MKRYELPKIFQLLDAFQVRTDDSIFSRETPMELQVIGRGRQQERNRLEVLMAPFPVENETINILFNVMLENYVGLAKELLPMET